MSKAKDLLKGGWHPKEESKPSLRGDFKGINQVAGWVGKGKATGGAAERSQQSNHSARPLNTLVDPAEFGPPPKHVAYHGPEAAAQTARASPSVPSASKPTSAAAVSSTQPTYHQPVQEQPAADAAPPVPYRANTSGLRTDHLPSPPGRRVGEETGQTKPQPPPRLPPRQNSHPDAYASEPPPSYTAATEGQPQNLNQNSVEGLSRAGVSVPELGIGQPAGHQTANAPPSTNQPLAAASSGQMNELQARFARMGKTSSESPAAAPSQGTSWSQKQSAVNTFSKFRQDPSSVSMSDARDAASTANNFRQRHGDQIQSVAGAANAAAAKKPPPPPTPPKRRTQNTEDADVADIPPPIPTASKPK